MKESVFFSPSQYCISSSSSSSSSRFSFELDYRFESYGRAILSFFVNDHVLNTTSALPLTFSLVVRSDFCSQSESNPFQCWFNPSNTNENDRIDITDPSASFSCTKSEQDCPIAYRCEMTDSLCWMNEMISQRCTNVTKSTTTCPCVKHRCMSGQCMDTSDQ